ncbi:MAG: hypothetical protein GYB66_09095 [Chloroflexi bacterium]|nr:hypothetical protein [Chloroflexota bacterium]
MVDIRSVLHGHHSRRCMAEGSQGHDATGGPDTRWAGAAGVGYDRDVFKADEVLQ